MAKLSQNMVLMVFYDDIWDCVCLHRSNIFSEYGTTTNGCTSHYGFNVNRNSKIDFLCIGNWYILDNIILDRNMGRDKKRNWIFKTCDFDGITFGLLKSVIFIGAALLRTEKRINVTNLL